VTATPTEFTLYHQKSGTDHDYSFEGGLPALAGATRRMCKAEIACLKCSLPEVLESVCPGELIPGELILVCLKTGRPIITLLNNLPGNPGYGKALAYRHDGLPCSMLAQILPETGAKPQSFRLIVVCPLLTICQFGLSPIWPYLQLTH